MKAAGYADGVDTELYVYNTDPNPRIAQAIQQALAAIGIRAQIKSLDRANVIAGRRDIRMPLSDRQSRALVEGRA